MTNCQPHFGVDKDFFLGILMLMLTPQQIRQLRASLGWTATELAFHLGVSENAIRRWEAGDRHPRYPTLEKLNKLLKKAEKEHGLVLA